ncbi:hypothetical protein D8B26_006202 [Coccidioides posadasii str. Silveira]|uniref:Predicted protein n=1 Tax=Coccidioides posadasii (strain RMSCC 757 / Silveira) TaxID=443226 RepID=E9DBC0_COCPS|nr:predicted protein [Coccidioides posadasii str. Silveira]QVM11555.1 hypothetical protein D8B26_006202 [Coccidioides posadasii str. Silveira]
MDDKGGEDLLGSLIGENQNPRPVNKAPGLASKVDSGSVQGDPHPTTKTGDPYHASITLGIKGKDRVVSAHVYPNGTVKFSKDYGQVKVDADPDAPEGESALK